MLLDEGIRVAAAHASRRSQLLIEHSLIPRRIAAIGYAFGDPQDTGTTS
jgi:hypothetical protein